MVVIKIIKKESTTVVDELKIIIITSILKPMQECLKQRTCKQSIIKLILNQDCLTKQSCELQL